MKKTFLSIMFISCISMFAKGQQVIPSADTTRTLLENDKLKVIEFYSNPGKDVCGKGMHTHTPHLSILLTDAKVKLTTSDGSIKDFDMKAGTTFWSEAETHMAVNNGSNPVRAYLIEVK